MFYEEIGNVFFDKLFGVIYEFWFVGFDMNVEVEVVMECLCVEGW